MRTLTLKGHIKRTASAARMLALISCLTIVLAAQAIAAATYTYTGPTFAGEAVGISGYFTVAAALPPNMTETEIYPDTYTFTYGSIVWNQVTSPLHTGSVPWNFFWVSTNAAGGITNDWSIELETSSGGAYPYAYDLYTYTTTPPQPTDWPSGVDMVIGIYPAPTDWMLIGDSDDPRSSSNWATTSTLPPTGVPEPSTLFLLVAGLSGLWVWGRRKFNRI